AGAGRGGGVLARARGRALAARSHHQWAVPGGGERQALERLSAAPAVAEVLHHDRQVRLGPGGALVPGTHGRTVVAGEGHVPGVDEREPVVDPFEGQERRGGLARLRERLLPEGHEILGLAELRAVLPQRLEGQVEQRHAGGLHGEDRAEAVLPSRWAKLTKKQPKVA